MAFCNSESHKISTDTTLDIGVTWKKYQKVFNHPLINHETTPLHQRTSRCSGWLGIFAILEVSEQNINTIPLTWNLQVYIPSIIIKR